MLEGKRRKSLPKLAEDLQTFCVSHISSEDFQDK